MADVTVKVNNNGPYVLEGPLTLMDADGNQFVLERERIFLCRCGQSANKPFCDSAHRTCGFESQVTAH